MTYRIIPPDWQSLKHHEAFQKSKIYPSFVAGVSNFAKSVASILHVPLRPYPANASFEAPVTEVLIATLKPDASREEFEKIIDMMHKGCKVTPGAIASSHGITLENDRKYVYVCGWDTIEVCVSQKIRFREKLKKMQILVDSP